MPLCCLSQNLERIPPNNYIWKCHLDQSNRTGARSADVGKVFFYDHAVYTHIYAMYINMYNMFPYVKKNTKSLTKKMVGLEHS